MVDWGSDATSQALEGIEQMISSSTSLVARVSPNPVEDFLHFHRVEAELHDENLPRPYVIIALENRRDDHVSPGCSYTNQQIIVRISDKARFRDSNTDSYKDFVGFIGGLLDDIVAKQQTSIFPAIRPLETVQSYKRTAKRDRDENTDFWTYVFRFNLSTEG